MIVFENILWLLVLIGIMILVHELGHYWAARYFDVRVETFSFGFGPRLFGVRRGETDFRFSLIPFGGYVKMAGEQQGDEPVTDPRSFLAKARWQRLIIAFAGPLMNIVLAVALLTGLFMFMYPVSPTEGQVVIGHVMEDSAAAKAGLREGDKIVQIAGVENPGWEDVMAKEVMSADQPLHVAVERDGERFETTVTPVLMEKIGIGFAGWAEQAEIQVGEVSPGLPAESAGLQRGDILLSAGGHPIHSRYKLQEVIRTSGGEPVEIEFTRDGVRQSVVVQPVFTDVDGGPERWMIGVAPEHYTVFTSLPLPHAFTESVRQNLRGATLIFEFLKRIIDRRMSAKTIDGPVGIARISGEAARQGIYPFITLMAIVSLNLAIINLLPIPILDGGVILMLLVEMTMRRDISLQVKEAAFKLGFVFLMAIMVFVLYNDIVKLLPNG